MQIKVENKNIKMVKGILEKLSKGKQLECQSFYPTDKKLKVIRKNLGIPKGLITESIKDTFSEVKIELDLDGKDYYLRVHNNGEFIPDDSFTDPYLAFVIKTGDKLTLKNNVISIKKPHPVTRMGKCIEILKFV